MEPVFKNFVQFINEADIQGNPAITPSYFSSLNRRAEAAVRRIEQRYGPEMARLMQSVMEVQQMQAGKERELEKLAEEVILDEFGSILGDTKLDIKIPQQQELKSMMQDQEQPEPEDLQRIEDEDTRTAINKRKILNMITQGEALNAKKLFTGEVAMAGLTKIFGEQGARKMVDLLVKITDIATAMDWRIPEEVAKEMWEQGTGFSGVSKVEWQPSKKDIEGGMGEDEPEEQEEEPQSDEATIIVRGLDFSMLVHEAIKGIYSLINQGGMAHLDDETVKKVFQNTETMADEIQDLKRGKLTAADLRDFMNTFNEIANIPNGRQYVWGKMIDANIVSDKDFLDLVKLIFESAPLYKSQEEAGTWYTDAERSIAEQAFPKAKAKVQELIDMIKQELSDWEESQKPKSVYDEDDEEETGEVFAGDDEENEPSYARPAEERPLSKREIQDLIDQALDRRDFAEVARLSNMNLNEFLDFVNEALSDEEREAILRDAEIAVGLVQGGVLPAKTFNKQRRKIYRQLGGDVVGTATDPILGQLIAPELHHAMQTDEFRELERAGWSISSTAHQMFNGTISLTTASANRNGPNGWPTSIAVTKNGYIRRIWSGRGYVGQATSRQEKRGEPQVIVSSLRSPGTTEMYQLAFRWIMDNIDPTSANLNSLPKAKKSDSGTGITRASVTYAERARRWREEYGQ